MGVQFAGNILVQSNGAPLPIVNGGTGQSSAQSALTALLPTQATNAGKVLSTNGTVASWTTPTGGGGTPGGSDTMIQFNDAGTFGGSANFVINKATGAVTGLSTLTNIGLNISDSVTDRALTYQTAGTDRWILKTDATAESFGTNIGSNFALLRVADNGATTNQVFTIERSSGILDFKTIPTINGAAVNAAGQLTGSTLASGVTGSSLTSVGTLVNLTVTNTISGSISGNAATATSATSATSATTATTAGSVTNSLTVNNSGTGAASGTTFNGGSAVTISYNTVGAAPLAGSASLTTTGTVTSGTWSASFGAVSGANLTSLTAGNLSGTIPSGVLGNSTVYIGTTAVALNRASGSLALTGITSIDGSAATVTGAAQTAITSVGTLTSLAVTGAITTGGTTVGYLTVPQVATGTVTLSNTYSGKHIFNTTASQVYTIPANDGSIPVGTAITFVNQGSGTCTVAITTDTLYLAGAAAGTPGTRTLAAYGMATALKITTTSWIISGTGLT